eukprot:IDg1294t1
MRWLEQLKYLLEEQVFNSGKARERYKRNFDRRLRRINYKPVRGGFVFLRRDYAADAVGGTRKLAPTADGPFLVKDLTGTTAVIQRGNQLEAVSLDRVVPAPMPIENIQGSPVDDVGDTGEYPQLEEGIAHPRPGDDASVPEEQSGQVPNDGKQRRRQADEEGAQIMVVKKLTSHRQAADS